MLKLSPARLSLLSTFISLVCIPTIHAAAIAASTAPNSPTLGQVARSWFSAFIAGDSDDDAKGLSVSGTATDATAYLRVASLSIALYECVAFHYRAFGSCLLHALGQFLDDDSGRVPSVHDSTQPQADEVRGLTIL